MTAIDSKNRRLTLWDALRDLGWFFALYAAVVGAPSILSILQMALEGFRLVPAIQWIVDGYNQLTAILGELVEPLFGPLLSWLSGLLGWELVLYPHWRPLFLIGMALVLGFTRTAVGQGQIWRGLLAGTYFAVACLAGALLAGLVPLSGSWLAQGLVAAVPVACFLAFLGALVLTPFHPDQGPVPLKSVGLALIVVIIVFLVAAAPSLVSAPTKVSVPGILVLGTFVALLGVSLVSDGISDNNRFNARAGLTITGGFVVAGLIIAVDAILKKLPQY